MLLGWWCICACLHWLAGGGASEVGILLICDQTFQEICRKKQYDAKGDVGVTLELVSDSNSYITHVENIHSLLQNDKRRDVIMVFGDSSLVSAAGTVVQGTRISVIAYNKGPVPTIYQDDIISVNSNMLHLGQAMMHLINSLRVVKHTHVFTDINLLYDGFLQGFWDGNLNFSHSTVLHEDMENEISLFFYLRDLRESGIKQFVVHARPDLVYLLMRANRRLDNTGRGYQWFLSYTSVSNFTDNDIIPEGTLVVESAQNDQAVVEYALGRIFEELENIVHNCFTGDIFDCIRDVRVNKSSKKNLLLSSGIGHFEISNRFWRVINETYKELEWMSAGNIFYNSTKHSIQWYGSTILGPIFHSKNFYRVVTTPSPPFVMIKGPIDQGDSCYGNKLCFKILKGNPMYLGPNTRLEDFKKNVEVERYCCSGFVMDILEYLSTDLVFDYLVYFRDEVGHNATDRRESMIYDVGNGTADIIAGALTITSNDSKILRFTEPYYFSGFVMAVPLETTKPSMDAFTAPFDGYVWLAIFLSATTAALATSLFEWNSPFGLNPWGRKRLKNYTLGSALVMVYSVLFGHTVSTKSPKSWPAKVLQNFWAGLAIFIVASYTANLAAYLAGISRVDEIISIFDQSMSSKRVYVTRSSPAANYLQVIKEKLKRNIVINEISPEETPHSIVKHLRDKTYDVFINDRLLLEYTLAQHDNCSIKFSGHDFGENLYAFGLNRDAIHLTENMSSLILSYLEGGQVTEAMQRYIKNRNCAAQGERFTRKYGLDHTGGLFIILLSAMFVGALLLIVELYVFKYLVPYLRKKPNDSLWKNRNIEYVNQRLYRTLMSEQLVSPQQTAQEMIRIVRERRFDRLFLKNELRDQGKIQKKGIPKGLRLIDITDNLIRSKKAESEIFATSSSSNLYSINEQEYDDDSLSDVSDYVTGDEQDMQISFEDMKDTVIDRSEVPINNQRQARQSCSEATRMQSLKVTPSQYVRCKQSRVRYCSDSNLGGSHSSSSYRRNKSCPNFQKHPTKDEKKQKMYEMDEIEMLEIAARPDKTKLIRKSKKANIGRAFTFYGKSLKDNRLKSSIRSHAMATRRHSESAFDDCAVDALSKEDLMVLWKKSEIELQTSLNRVTQENTHLKRLLRVVEVSENVPGEEVSKGEAVHITATPL
ncbi:glutamate receptor ionotropic, NMDA 1-like [Saccostrea echinata]|uniref:glutamate receptor ionotropic, NMDA 1-like n=1 Tax=Saccostrea echinata TaxID=191078 RepID=UPI002A81F62D|nr:glutamate receptor ionotropic, NMDA 1-like [Saccostrea echinata]